jgi:hypothetical protein
VYFGKYNAITAENGKQCVTCSALVPKLETPSSTGQSFKRQLSLMLARALECAVARFGVGIYPNNSLRRNQMNYCKILTYLVVVKDVQESIWNTGATYKDIDWSNIERLHDALNDAEINELDLIYSGV